MAKKKHNKKNKPVPCSDTNQHVKEHTANIKKQNDYLIKKLAEYRAKQMARRASTAQPSTTTITEPRDSDDTSSETIFN